MFKMDFNFIKYSRQGGLAVKKRAVAKTFIFTEIQRHLPITSVNDPFDIAFLNPFNAT